jgi:hypothetical protein
MFSFYKDWFARWRQLGRRSAATSPRRRAHLQLEPLEARQLLSTSQWVYPGADGHLVYAQDNQGNTIPDFSMVGYLSGNVPLPGTGGTPDVPVQMTLSPNPDGDDTQRIQDAINYVSGLPVGDDGFRGAVLLTAGQYRVNDHVEIRASGVVLRGDGAGSDGTVILATGTERRFNSSDPTQDGVIRLEGDIPTTIHLTASAKPPRDPTSPQPAISDDYVPVGARTFTVASAAGLNVGDPIIVHRPSPLNWLQDIGMNADTYGSHSWQPGSTDLDSDRMITAITGKQITIDAPLTNALEQQYGGGSIYRYSFPGRIDHVGVEDIRGDSSYTSSTDESHAWDFISLIGVQNAFVDQVAAQHYAFATVDVQKTAKWVTVQACSSDQPISSISGDRRYAFHNSGQLNFFTDCHAQQGRHDFAEGSIVPGPNVFVNCTSDQEYDESGPHLHWSTGILYDNVVSTNPAGTSSDRGNLSMRNRGQDSIGSLQGWDGANCVVWGSQARQLTIEHPPTAQNWVIGNSGVPAGDYQELQDTGYWELQDQAVEPTSLYYAQLADRQSQGPSASGLGSKPSGALVVSLPHYPMTVPVAADALGPRIGWNDTPAGTGPSGFATISMVPIDALQASVRAARYASPNPGIQNPDGPVSPSVVDADAVQRFFAQFDENPDAC